MTVSSRHCSPASLAPSSTDRTTKNSSCLNRLRAAGFPSRSTPLQTKEHHNRHCSSQKPATAPRKAKMAYQPSHTATSASQLSYALPEHDIIDLAQQGDLSPWLMTTVIDDDDLTFGGKSLSTWYEEDRRRLSVGDSGATMMSTYRHEEEERRGRQRDRPRYDEEAHRHHKTPRTTPSTQRRKE